MLEVGIGTGRNVPYYKRASRVVGIDPDPSMLRRATRRAAESRCPVEFHVGAAEDLPFPQASFDTVVMTLILCTIPDPAAALTEIRRVLKPHGQVIFLEHERSPNCSIARLQDLATPIWSRIAGGCHLNRSTVATIGRGGFEITQVWRSRGGSGSLVQGNATIRQRAEPGALP